MLSVNSLSGGKTSSFLEKHYPADISVFALVCMDDYNSNAGSTTLKVDKHIRQVVNDKLQRYCSDQHEFVCTAEDPIIIKTILELEQHTGREIIWLRGKGFQPASFGKGMLPNKKHRWCTTIFKIEPIFNFLFRYHTLPVKMRIGYRADEAHRVNNFRDTYIMSTHCEIKYPGEQIGNFKTSPLSYITKSGKVSTDYFRGTSLPHRHRWQEVPFRIGEFPLIEDGITQYDVQKYWQDKNVPFPEDSNCQFCFWKHPQQLRKNFDKQPGIMYSAVVLEDMQNSTLRPDLSMLQIRNIAPQMELFQMRGGSCQGGYCTD